ncbi:MULTISPECIES: MW1434 family type I TA system toxin [Bacillus cereus group]|uniref:Thoeris anti-defense Tad2 family protein n=1 Tax=Bacillus cereus group TaxID=86661 RepID=UPI0003D36B2E|nr:MULTISPECIES: MW1434 family type I TA system toxin [Bacillus cereus group]ETE93221.1 hypothetical protein C623_0225475 [Bacillus thuringiensis serovar aizawai str. Hu4-2]MEC2958245.1 DUF2829 domain-containing protein [Bacillus cereus]OUA15197.1 hypothetical protein BK777_29565 [Bacillus thuringiensis serovar aizawai]
MNFGQALEALKQGKKVTRSIWGGYWFLSKNPEVKEELNAGYVRGFQTHDMIFAVLKDNGGVAPAQAYQADMLAEDWVILN